MWESLLIACIPAAAAVVSIIITHKRQRELIGVKMDEIRKDFNLRSRDQELSVSRVILPRCVDALQGLYTQARAMNDIFSTASFEEDPDFKKAKEQLKKAKAWLDNNCVYLPGSLRNETIKTINDGYDHLRQLHVEGSGQVGTGDVWKRLFSLFKELIATIDAFMGRYNLIEQSMDEEGGKQAK